MRRKTVKTVEAEILPRELQRSAPRDVTLSVAGRFVAACAVLLIAGGLIGGVVLGEQSVARGAMAEELRRRGVTVYAEVINVRRTRGDQPSMTVSYRFGADGREYRGQTRLRRRDRLWSTAQRGTVVRIRYLPDTPEHSWLDGYGPEEIPMWIAVLVPMLAVPGGFVILVVLRHQWHLLADGRPAMAHVVEVKKTSKTDDTWRVDYAWRLLNGAERKGHLSRSSKPAEGASFVPLIYDPDRPERHATYPLSLVKVR